MINLYEAFMTLVGALAQRRRSRIEQCWVCGWNTYYVPPSRVEWEREFRKRWAKALKEKVDKDEWWRKYAEKHPTELREE